MKALDLMEDLKRYLGGDDLVLTRDTYGYRLRTKENVVDDQGQILYGGDLDDGKRLLIVSFVGLTDKVQSFLDRKGLLYAISDGSPTHIYIYPNADKSLLGIQAQPTQGNVQIIQGEYAITHANDPNPILSTFGIGTCVGLLLFDPKLRLGGVAHVDFEHEIVRTLEKMLKELDEFGAQKLVFGRTPNIDSLTRKYIVRKYGTRLFSEIELPREFSLNTRTGKVELYQASEDPTLNKRMDEKTNHRFEENITMCFPVYTSKAQP